MIKRFKVCTTVEYEHIIEIDDNVWNEQALSAWSEVFFKANLVQHAENIAWHESIRNSDFIEGYGYVLRNGVPSWTAKRKNIDSDESINIITVSSEDVDQTTYELTSLE